MPSLLLPSSSQIPENGCIRPYTFWRVLSLLIIFWLCLLQAPLPEFVTYFFSFPHPLPFFSLFLLALHPQHMEVPRLGVESELQLLAAATATWDPSCYCDLHHRSRQCQILNPLSEARDRTLILMDASRVH